MVHPICYRYLVAARLQGAEADLVIRTRNLFGVHRKPVARHRLHLTLCLTADFPAPQPALIERHLQALDDAALPPCRVTLDEIVGNGESVLLRSFWKLTDAHALQERVARHLASRNVGGRPGTEFCPHVTIAYDTSWRGNLPIEPITWTVTELALIESRVGAGEHRLLQTWPLTGDAGGSRQAPLPLPAVTFAWPNWQSG